MNISLLGRRITWSITRGTTSRGTVGSFTAALIVIIAGHLREDLHVGLGRVDERLALFLAETVIKQKAFFNNGEVEIRVVGLQDCHGEGGAFLQDLALTLLQLDIPALQQLDDVFHRSVHGDLSFVRVDPAE